MTKCINVDMNILEMKKNNKLNFKYGSKVQ